MSYQLKSLFLSALSSVLFVFLWKQENILILFLRQQLNFDIVNVAAVQHKLIKNVLM
jgi:hypothetical protein